MQSHNSILSKCVLFLLLFYSISFSYPGELLIYQKNPTNYPISVRIQLVSDGWSWNTTSNQVVNINSFDQTYTHLPISYDAPKNVNSGLNGVIPWGLIKIGATIANSTTIWCYIDLRDEGWSQDITRYPQPDTRIYIDQSIQQIQITRDSYTFDNITSSSIQIWDYWQAGAPQQANFHQTSPIVTISGPISLAPKTSGTYQATISGISGLFSYQWSWKENYLGTWFNQGTSSTQNMLMNHADRTIQCIVNNLYTGQLVVYCADNSLEENKAEKSKSFESNLPNKPTLFQNYPNPFNPSTNIEFYIPSSAFVSLKIYDLLGREVTNLVSEDLGAGNYSIVWNASRMSAGLYFCRLQLGNIVETKQLVLLK